MFVKSNRCCVMSHERDSPAYYSDLLPATSISRHSAECRHVNVTRRNPSVMQKLALFCPTSDRVSSNSR